MLPDQTQPDKLPECPYARDFMRGNPRYKEFERENRSIQAAADSEDWFLVLAPEGKNGRRYFELWRETTKVLPRTAVRMAVLRKRIYGDIENPNEPIRSFDQRLWEFIPMMDNRRTTDEDRKARANKAHVEWEQKVEDYKKQYSSDVAAELTKVAQQSTPRAYSTVPDSISKEPENKPETKTEAEPEPEPKRKRSGKKGRKHQSNKDKSDA